MIHAQGFMTVGSVIFIIIASVFSAHATDLKGKGCGRALSERQQATIGWYEQNASKYVKDTRTLDLSATYAKFLKDIAPAGKILDAGSGSGRDSKYFLDHGYSVEAFDASAELAKSASQYLGQQVLNLHFEEIEFENEFDGVWARASLLHVPQVRLNDSFSRLVRALKVNGIMYVSFKEDVWNQESLDDRNRHFSNFSDTSLRQFLSAFPNLEIIEIESGIPDPSGRSGVNWIQAILHKTQR